MTSGWQLRDILEAARLILSAESVVLIARFFASREEKQILRSAQDDILGGHLRSPVILSGARNLLLVVALGRAV